MFLRNASFILAAGIAHPALAQTSTTDMPSPDFGRLHEELAETTGPLDARQRNSANAGAGAETRFAMPAIAFNPDGPYFLDNVAGNRRQPGYEPIARRIGSFVVSPSVVSHIRTDDNWTARGQTLPLLTVIGTAVEATQAQFGFALPGGASAAALARTINPDLVDVADVAVDLVPAVAISSDWSRNALSLDASARLTRFASIRRLDREEFQVGSRGTLDLSGNVAVSARVSFARQAEPYGTNGLAVLDYFGFGPSLLHRFTAGAAIAAKFSRTSVALDAEYVREEYLPLQLDIADLVRPDLLPLPGLPDRLEVSQSYRDRSQANLRLRVSYALAPDFDVYLVPSYSRNRQARQASDAEFVTGTPSFSSDTFGIVAGVRKDFSHLFVVQAGLRFQLRNYDSPALARSRRFDIEGAADWYPTPLISLRVHASQQFRGSGILGQADIVTRTIGARADYEVLRNVGLRLDGSASWDSVPAAVGQPGTAGRSARQEGAVRVVWTMGRSTELNFSAGGHRRRAGNSIFLGSFASSRFSISLTRRI